jgi:uncharacterized membrane protein (UPF0127 family)
MRLVHGSGPDRRVLASEVERADTLRSQVLGLRFRDDLPEGHAMVIDAPDSALSLLGSPSPATVDMLGVGFPLDVVWVAEEQVRKVKRLSPWLGLGMARADTVVELPAGGADGIAVGDRLVLEA